MRVEFFAPAAGPDFPAIPAGTPIEMDDDEARAFVAAGAARFVDPETSDAPDGETSEPPTGQTAETRRPPNRRGR